MQLLLKLLASSWRIRLKRNKYEIFSFLQCRLMTVELSYVYVWKDLKAPLVEKIFMLAMIKPSNDIYCPTFFISNSFIKWKSNLFFMILFFSQCHQELLNHAASKITNLKKKDMDDKFIICLNKVSKHFPPFMDQWVCSSAFFTVI